MALTDDGINMSMPVQPFNNGNNNGFGFGGDGAWLILFLLLALGGNWGNNWGGNNGGIVPSIDGSMQRGFDQSAVMGGINGLTSTAYSGISDIQAALCNGFAGVNQGVSNGFAQAEIANNSRQMADMNQNFGMQTAMMQGFNGLQAQLASCCCDNRLATCQTQNAVQAEASATRFADANNTRDIIDSQTRGTQAILDKLCALELDGVKGQLAQAQRDNVSLQNQLNMAAMRESQTAQNAFIAQGLSNEVDALYNRLNNCPVPTVPVYGKQPIFTCGNNGCGCGNM